MKTKAITLIILVALTFFAKAQPLIPNGTLEQWEGAPEYPLGWSTDQTPDLKGIIAGKSTDAHSGTYSAVLKVQNFDSVVHAGAMTCGFGMVPLDPSYFYVWVKMRLSAGDDFIIDLLTTNGGAVVSNNTQHYVSTVYSSWTQLTIPLNDVTPGQSSDSVHISFSYASATDTNSYVMVDDVSFDNGTPVNEVSFENGGMEQLYPNPAKGIENLVYSLGERSNTSLQVSDMLGNIVQHVFSETQGPGRYRAEIATGDLTDGIYIAMLNVNGKTVQQKFIVQHY